MASFARSFKPSPAYLSPCRRPVMPGRTLSNSSDLSLASTGDDAGDAPVPSAPGTPSAEDAWANKNASSIVNSPKSGNSGPIAIELPKLKKLNAAAAVYTPPEPLSARGDLPGGYFPMHEDPKGRIHRPHPFHQDAGFSRHHLHSDTAAMQTDRKDSHSAAFPASMAHASMPVASYLAPGFHDSPLPMGKYYPSNYEQHQRTNVNHRAHPSVSESLPSSMRHDSHLSRHGSQIPRGEAAEAEARRKMQQYQRDMIAQAAMALGGSTKAESKAAPGVSLGGKSLKDAWLAGPSPHKPTSPRLHPLGSPGPVTPMDLEAASAGGYLEYGKKPQDWLSKENKAAITAGHATRSL
ncbi:hypothetical protein HRG_009955 [Hirsutella rhossiliensis]|uniref:Uncharacterized protein n=1 Tax=Hirsutella rhossiliensis TaxID=111463 RepID=A0A9P8SF00_9HYPO|nr:uncharacterized protein HRG_09955 [Hirsutella rhossiliensis]KAH0958910.1 hypothetical protein HRG_09955 [Hirsutella rhossiliensis]